MKLCFGANLFFIAGFVSIMSEARFQRWIKKNIWNPEVRSETVNLENPNVPLNGFTLAEVLGGGRPSMAGVIITPENSLKISAVWRCVNILSGVISSMPAKPFIESDSGREEARNHSTWNLFTKRPSPLYTKTVYWERAIIHLLMRGNHYAEIIYNNGGQIMRFDIVLPHQVKKITLVGNTLYYDIEGRDLPVPMDRMIHVPHMGEDPISGKSTITYAREDLGMETARRDSGAKFWYDGGDVKGMITTSQKVSDPQMAMLKESMRNKKREGGTIVAPYGVDYKNIGLPPADQEFIMSGNFSIAQICRWFGVPLHKLSELDRATMNNIEHQAIEFLQDTIAPIICKIENEYSTKLYTLPSEQDMKLEFNMQSYQRADSQAMSEYFRSGIQNGYLSPNEVAKKLNEKQVKGGDRHFIQQNMMPLDSVDSVLMKQKTQPSTKSALIANVRALADLAEQEYKLNGNGH